jgi:hypothetical protein
MKKQIKAHLFLLFGFLLSTQTPYIDRAFAASSCKVIGTDIEGEYSGGCINGLAQGKGVAKGTDSIFRQLF